MSKPIFDKKNVLVTGGAGFIGSHLCDTLVREGVRVICMDNFVSSQERNIDFCSSIPIFNLFAPIFPWPFNLEAFPELEAFKIPFQGIQEVYHLACPTAIKRFDAHRIDTLNTNGHGTLNVLEIAEKYEARVVMASSSVVYGGRTEGRLFLRKTTRVLWITPLRARCTMKEALYGNVRIRVRAGAWR